MTKKAKTDLTSKAILVKLTIKAWTGLKTDLELSGEIAANHGSQADAYRVSKTLLDREHIKPITKHDGQTRAQMKAWTLPWSESGYDVLPSALITRSTNYLEQRKAERLELVQNFFGEYERLAAEGQRLLGSTYRPEDYPTLDQLDSKFRFDFDFQPIADGDWRVNINDEERERIAAHHDARAKERFRDATKDAKQRIFDTLERFSERLDAYDPEKPKAHPLHATAVSTVADLIDLIPAFNLDDDTGITKVHEKIVTKLGPVLNLTTLKEDSKARAKASKAAAAIRKDVQGLFT